MNFSRNRPTGYPLNLDNCYLHINKCMYIYRESLALTFIFLLFLTFSAARLKPNNIDTKIKVVICIFMLFSLEAVNCAMVKQGVLNAI